MPDGSSRGLEISPDVLQKLSGVLLTQQTLEEVLQLVVELAEASIPLADAASVSVKTDGKRITPASSKKMAMELDQLQYDNNEGPCVDAMTTGKEILSFPLERARWRTFATAAIADGVNGMYSLPLRAARDTIGALNLYSRSDHGPADKERDLGRMFAEQAAVVVANSAAFNDARRLSEQLQEALASRDLIGQAKGILMLREGYGPHEAFDALKKMSQDSNIKLRDVARQVVESAHKSK
ncbi:MAG: GAF and ANTAR domain-containing protein [Actinomycetota bacterium]|nr:GAF and ANTAR domain-containing protein [Actinomycetota bacterium]